MGNLFEQESDARRNRHQSENDSSAYLQPEEIQSIRAVFNGIFLAPVSTDELMLQNVSFYLAKNKRNHFCSIIHAWLVKNINTFALFEKFVINSTRISNKETIQTLLKMVQDHSHQEKLVERSIFRIIIELGSQLDTEDAIIDALANEMTKFYEWTRNNSSHYRFKHRAIEEDGQLPNIRQFTEFLNEFLPFSAKVYESHITAACMPSALASPSYKAFDPPRLSHKSAIVDQLQLLPLALHSKSLQGYWTRLYTSESDGMSFNRLEHHILGYEVQPLPWSPLSQLLVNIDFDRVPRVSSSECATAKAQCWEPSQPSAGRIRIDSTVPRPTSSSHCTRRCASTAAPVEAASRTSGSTPRPLDPVYPTA